jgi:hypothetical protein
MKYVYANSCRVHRHVEGLEGLLMSRGRGMVLTPKAQAFGWSQIDPQGVPSTA